MSISPIAQALSSLQALGQRPALTWYSGSGERLELSGDVTLNWLNKTANFLVDSAAEPGTRVLLDLPPHWRTIVWGVATLRTGATAVPAKTADAAERTFEVVITDRAAGPHPDADLIAVVTLAALARRYPGELPAGLVDAGPAVMGSADSIIYLPGANPAATALDLGTSQVAYGDLLDWLAAGPAVPAGARVAVRVPGAGAAEPTSTLLAGVLRLALSAWLAGGSIVLVSEVQDDSKFASIAASERADVTGIGI
ncbi:hypothetical protein GCM10010401_03390 [Rarobacter faecitabidus]|uniref:Uncharacterized protein (TIGR03089 family) n=1 Tax=Rarobacter faecitabidus TaxID=13243 RepID=A0A542ZU71_RARFA|nr:TIGR03089 family protein [Rarobacter faecitabidus]TQL63905.1 uncharacterized protein (TIGR03089 family) [Rarobacter faecitabidus]